MSARFGVPAGSLRLAVAAAQQLPARSVRAVSRWVDALASLDADAQEECATTIAEALEALTRGEDDPLASVDDPLNQGERLQAVIQAEQDVQASRRQLLSESVSAAEAGMKCGRSRQNLEVLHRKGQVLALRVGNQWRYPVWQFDPDGVGGLVPGLRHVIAALRLSSAGAALWFIQPCHQLKGARPIDLLRQGRVREVMLVAQELGHAP